MIFLRFFRLKDIFVPCSIQKHFVIFSMICFTSYSLNKEKFLHYHQLFTCYTVIWWYHMISCDCTLICWMMVTPSSMDEKLKILVKLQTIVPIISTREDALLSMQKFYKSPVCRGPLKHKYLKKRQLNCANATKSRNTSHVIYSFQKISQSA